MRAVVLLALAGTLAARPAAAQPSSTPPSPPPEAYTERYGGTIAAVDGISLAVGGVGFLLVIDAAFDDWDDGNGSEGQATLGWGMVIAGTGGYFLGGPIVHARRNNPHGAIQSLGARVLLPLAGGLIGSLDDDDTAGAMVSLGYVSAMILDWAVLARHEVEPRVTPYVSTGRDGTVVGLGGRF